jgi:hypothetical protein
VSTGRLHRSLSRVLLAFAVVSGDVPAAGGQGDWMLMSRHGECAALASLRREVPDLPDIAEPGALIEFLESRRHFVEARPLPGSAGRAYEVQVSDLSLHLVLVRESLCAQR